MLQGAPPLHRQPPRRPRGAAALVPAGDPARAVPAHRLRRLLPRPGRLGRRLPRHRPRAQGAAHRPRGRAATGPSRSSPSEIMLSSAVCHSLYGTLPRTSPPRARAASAAASSSATSPSPDPTRLQAFRMYEFVLVGTPAAGAAPPRLLDAARPARARGPRPDPARRGRQRPVLRSRRQDARRRPDGGRAEVRVRRRHHRRHRHRHRLGQLPAGPLRPHLLAVHRRTASPRTAPASPSASSAPRSPSRRRTAWTWPPGPRRSGTRWDADLDRHGRPPHAAPRLDQAPDPPGCRRPGPGASVAVHPRVWFGDPEPPLPGWLSAPADGRARGGVVLCPPMGEEGALGAPHLPPAGRVAWPRRAWWRCASTTTAPATPPGPWPTRTGSTAWQDSVVAARALPARARRPPRSPAVGMRLGATLAASVAPAPAPRCRLSLVLWDPCVSGRLFLRESEALHAFGEDATPRPRPDDGLRHTPGFQYDAATAARAARPRPRPRSTPSIALAGRVLLLSRDDRPGPPPASTRLEQRGRRADPRRRPRPAPPARPEAQRRARAAARRRRHRRVARPRAPRPSRSRSTLPPPGPDAGVVLGAARPAAGRACRCASAPSRLGDVGLAGVVVEPARRSRPAAADRPVGRAAQRRRRAPHRSRPPLGGVRPRVGRPGPPRAPRRPQRDRRQPHPPGRAREPDVRPRVDRRHAPSS